MSNDISITFSYQDESYNGILAQVSGAASYGGVWFLMIDKRYLGQLHNTDKGWVFLSQTGKFNELAEHFGDYLIACYDCS